MSVILLVRHGQASFGTDDYDRLSDHGRVQARLLGASLAAHGVTPSVLIAGNMARQRATADEAAGSAGWTTDVRTDPGWDEFDATGLLDADPRRPGDPEALTDPRTFQRLLERASARWASGDHDEDYPEYFTAFTDRIDAAMRRAEEGVGPGGTTVVFSSAGVIAWVTATLIGGGFTQWLALNRVAVNSAITKVVVGRQGLSLISYNDHSHLVAGDVTYR